MKSTGIALLILLKILLIENRMLPFNYLPTDQIFEVLSEESRSEESNENDKVIGLRTTYEDHEEYDVEYDKKLPKKPCAVVVLSNVQNPNNKSLLRRYRYDSKGILIPSSVKYFMKVPQGRQASPLLLPLNDKAFSPIGGFVRYYKEVPPIPHAW